MGGLYVYSAIAAAALLALSIWTWRRYDVPPSRQMEIAFFFSGFLLWVGTMIGFYSSFQVPIRVIARQNGKFTPPAAPSNKGALLARAVPESGVLGDAGSAASSPLAGYDQWTAVYDISAHTAYLPNGWQLTLMVNLDGAMPSEAPMTRV